MKSNNRQIDLIIGCLVGLSLEELYSKYLYWHINEIRDRDKTIENYPRIS